MIVLVKTGDTTNAAATAVAMQPHGVLSLQNGLVEDLLRAACPGLRVGQGVTTEGAYRDSHGIHPSGAGEPSFFYLGIGHDRVFRGLGSDRHTAAR